MAAPSPEVAGPPRLRIRPAPTRSTARTLARGLGLRGMEAIGMAPARRAAGEAEEAAEAEEAEAAVVAEVVVAAAAR